MSLFVTSIGLNNRIFDPEYLYLNTYMIIGIVGDADRAVTWERHLRPHNIVRQVVLAPHVHDLNKVDVCFVVDSTPNRTEHLLDALKEGIPCFFISDFIVPSK